MTHADRFEPLDQETLDAWAPFLQWEDRRFFPQEVGLVVEEIRTDYARMRLPYRPELNQPAGVVHGGAIATLIDTVVVPAIGQAYEIGRVYLTIGMNISYLGAVVQEDAIAEGWVEQRGRSIVFCGAEVRTASGKIAAQASLTYKVNKPQAA
jgi:uncharacterized protein (TIGR00369 family)